MSKRNLVIIAVVWLVVLAAGLSAAVTINLAGSGEALSLPYVNRGGVLVTEEEYEILQRYARLEEVRRIIEEDYYTEVDNDQLTLGAIQGMLSSLSDRYTFYYTVDEMKEATTQNTGVYQGIGVTIFADHSGNIVFLQVYRNTPAERAGILAGDILAEVNGEPVSGEDAQGLDLAKRLIEACGQEEMELTILREGESMKVRLRREQVTMDRVNWRLLEDQIGYIQITDFLGNDVIGFMEALADFEQTPLKGLIIDLRNNTGGYLDDVVAIADAILPEGLVVYTEDRAGNRREELSDAKCVDYPVVCLVNEMSASASEVLAGAVQDYGVGAIIGETTFGKGIVQTVWTFEDGAGMQLTTATYYTPLGRCIHGTGVTPDYIVPDDPETEEDETLLFAQKWLAEK